MTTNIIAFRPRAAVLPAAAVDIVPLIVDLPVQACFGTGEPVPSIVRVCGERELELLCERDMAHALKPSRGFLTTAHLPSVDLRIYLPLTPSRPPIAATCAVTRIAVTGSGDFVVSLRLVVSDPGAIQLLARFRVGPDNGYLQGRSLQA